jgi:hypothetical protein
MNLLARILLAIGDVVRTSLGPKGMDKMVRGSNTSKSIYSSHLCLDSNRARRSYRYERWGHNIKAYRCPTSSGEDGECLHYPMSARAEPATYPLAC